MNQSKQSISIIIPTYNRREDLMLTLPQILQIMDDDSELIVFDQSDELDREELSKNVGEISSGKALRYYHCDTPSVPLAWNTAATLATGDILLFLDDDINLDSNILDAHRQYYAENTRIVGVAGGYYASNYDRVWIPSSRLGSAKTLAGVNTSFLKNVFLRAGCASSFIASFAPFDWELAEFVNRNYGPIAVGSRALVYHRAPAEGGCENQKKRGTDWYRRCYHNYMLWMLYRNFPFNLLMLPRHFYSLMKYCVPKDRKLVNTQFLKDAAISGSKSGYQTYLKDGKVRKADMHLDSAFDLIFASLKAE